MENAKLDDITHALRERVLSGEFGTGGRLPSQRMFAEEYGTSRETIHKVIQRLQAEGLVTSLGLQGVYVHASRSRVPGQVMQFASYLKQLGLEAMESAIGTPEVLNAPSDVARFLKVSEGTPVVYSLRRQGTTTTHYRLIEIFCPAELLDSSVLEHVQSGRDFDVLQSIKYTYGSAQRRVHEDVIGRFPVDREQDLLKIVRGTPVLEVNDVYYAEDGAAIIMYSRSVLVASYFVLSYDYTASLAPQG